MAQAEEEGTVNRRVDEGKLVENFLVDYVKITGFDVYPSETYYSEREWRKVGVFRFEKGDVEAVVAPRKHLPWLHAAIFDDLGYPDTVNLLSWEFVEKA